MRAERSGSRKQATIGRSGCVTLVALARAACGAEMHPHKARELGPRPPASRETAGRKARRPLPPIAQLPQVAAQHSAEHRPARGATTQHTHKGCTAKKNAMAFASTAPRVASARGLAAPSRGVSVRNGAPRVQFDWPGIGWLGAPARARAAAAARCLQPNETPASPLPVSPQSRRAAPSSPRRASARS